jgi:hypothetical protein
MMADTERLLDLRMENLRLTSVAVRAMADNQEAIFALQKALYQQAPREVVEEARLRCVSTYEVQLDLIGDSIINQRQIVEAEGG